jgi:hypothetical protein
MSETEGQDTSTRQEGADFSDYTDSEALRPFAEVVARVVSGLLREVDELRAKVAELEEHTWPKPTPAEEPTPATVAAKATKPRKAASR